MIVIDAKRNAVTCIGRLGENEARIIKINVSQIMRAFPGAAFTVLHRRPGDMDAYPVNGAYIAMDGENVLWTVTSGDVAKEGIGQFEVIATVDGTVVKTLIYTSRVDHALDGAGDPPEPWESWVTDVTDAADRAEAAAQLLEHPGAESETLEPGSPATAGYSDGTFTFGIPQGEKGDTGEQGPEGPEGPAGQDGRDGQDGAPGADGFSPTASVSKSGKVATITITDKNGTTTTQVSDGADGTDIIDDTAGAGDTDKTWSASKSAGEVGSLMSQINVLEPSASAGDVGKVLKAKTVADGKVSEYEFGSLPSVPVTDVQVNGTSILSHGVANVPVASSSELGAVMVGDGLGINPNNKLRTVQATGAQLKQGINQNNPVTSGNHEYATFYGLAKAAGADMASLSSVTVGQYPEAQRVAIQKMLGIYESPWELIREDEVIHSTSELLDITVDGNGQTFELTDIRMLIQVPTQETDFVITNYASIAAYYGETAKLAFVGIGNSTYTITANSVNYTLMFMLEWEKGMTKMSGMQLQKETGRTNLQTGLYYNPTSTNREFLIGDEVFSKISIPAYSGTLKYRLYGKRKWT